MSPKPPLTAEGHVSSPASVASSMNPSSQLTPAAAAEGPASSQEDGKMEVKKQEDEEDEGAESQGEGKGKMGKGQSDVKTEEKPEVRSPEMIGPLFSGTSRYKRTAPSFQIKKEKLSGDGCKGEPMDTSSSSVSTTPAATSDDKKPEVKKEPKEEEEGSGSAGNSSSPASAQSKKKSKYRVWAGFSRRRRYPNNDAAVGSPLETLEAQDGL